MWCAKYIIFIFIVSTYTKNGYCWLRKARTLKSVQKGMTQAGLDYYANKKEYRDGNKRVTVRLNSTRPSTLNTYSIRQTMENYAKKSLDNVTVEVVGKTSEYNEIVLVKITAGNKGQFRSKDNSDKYSTDEPEKKIVLIVHGLNTEEIFMVGGLSRTKDFETLLSMYTKHVDKFDIFIIPIANPDGFAMSENDEYWGKNTSPQSACPGVFLDRNFDVAWNETREVNSCNPYYPGPNAFSEAESRAVRDIIHQYTHKLIAYFSVHPHSPISITTKTEAVLYPKGYTEITNDDDKYVDMRGDIEEALKNVTFDDLPIDVTTLYNWYGKISGSSVDYAAKIYGVPYSFEFVMQSYTGYRLEALYNKYILKDIWEKIIDVIFNNMFNSLKTTNENK